MTSLFYHTRIEPKGFLTSVLSPLVRPFVKRAGMRDLLKNIRLRGAIRGINMAGYDAPILPK